MFKMNLLIFGFLCYFIVSINCERVTTNARTLFSILNDVLKHGGCGSRSCPPWKCQDDSAVIHGYCCKCPGWRKDNVPVPCYPDLRCPSSSEPLCTDYNFMMECCCTGP